MENRDRLSRKDEQIRRNNTGGRLALIGITLVIVVFACTLALRTDRMERQDAQYADREQMLDKALEEEKKRTDMLEEKRRYVDTPEYYRELAKKILGLVDRDEYKLEENNQ